MHFISNKKKTITVFIDQIATELGEVTRSLARLLAHVATIVMLKVFVLMFRVRRKFLFLSSNRRLKAANWQFTRSLFRLQEEKNNEIIVKRFAVQDLMDGLKHDVWAAR